ncbi:MAG: DUF362 domain-containing protein [Candidatus Omnitrophica bacterium]|nr:DUF362 domain-containing protein [Candidatus Omnitrophota bacterium]
MKSKVYFVAVNDGNDAAAVNKQLNKLLAESRVLDFIRKEDKVGVKVHFGEEGNTGFVRPHDLRVICDGIRSKGASALLSDANTLYRGRRLNSKEHLALAYEHGFTKEAVGIDIFIPDDNKKEDVIDISVGGKLIKTAQIARFFIDIDALVTVSHFKGHILTGFGGALKNIGMGCATREGKLAQHCDVAPVVYADKCTGCGECAIICPAGAIQIKNKKSVLVRKKCIGCASCIAVCPSMAMFIDIESGDDVQQKIAEYSLAVLKSKKGKVVFINFAVRINQECDCWGMENPRIAPDVGIFASSDPVSIDKASFDLVNEACGKNIFKEAHPKQDGLNLLKYAQDLGLGSLDYDLIKL